MRVVAIALLTALTLGVGAAPAEAAEAVRADIVLHVVRVNPTHRLALASTVEVPYGPGSLGFAPRGPERQARGPEAFDVDPRGGWVVADPVRGRIVRVVPGSGPTSVSSVADLPMPFTDLAVDRDGVVHVVDGKTRGLWSFETPTAVRKDLPIAGLDVRFVRHGQDLVVGAGGAPSVLRSGVLTSFGRQTLVEKCNAEAGRVTLGHDGTQVQVEIGGPLASIRLIGVSAARDTFLLVEQFRERGRVEVDRRVVVLGASGALKASLELEGNPAVSVVRDLVLGPRGDLHRMLPGDRGVIFSRWEVRP
jgi:hypothetical protein